MKIAGTLILAVVAILALFLLLMDALGVGFGVRVGGNLFADGGLSSLNPVYLVLLIVASVGGLFLLWRSSRRAG